MYRFLTNTSVFLTLIFFNSIGYGFMMVQPVTKTVTNVGEMYRQVTLMKAGNLTKQCDFISHPKPDEPQISCSSTLNGLQGSKTTEIGDENYDILKDKYESQEKARKNMPKVQYSPINALISNRSRW